MYTLDRMCPNDRDFEHHGANGTSLVLTSPFKLQQFPTISKFNSSDHHEKLQSEYIILKLSFPNHWD